jgi:hypothetical protein
MKSYREEIWVRTAKTIKFVRITGRRDKRILVKIIGE